MIMISNGLILHQGTRDTWNNDFLCSNCIFSQVATYTRISGTHNIMTFWAYRVITHALHIILIHYTIIKISSSRLALQIFAKSVQKSLICLNFINGEANLHFHYIAMLSKPLACHSCASCVKNQKWPLTRVSVAPSSNWPNDFMGALTSSCTSFLELYQHLILTGLRSNQADRHGVCLQSQKCTL